MPTTVHIPAEILRTVDRRARAQKISRNKYIVEALKARLEAEQRNDDWPRGLFDDMKAWREDQKHVATVREMKRIILANRRSRKSPLL